MAQQQTPRERLMAAAEARKIDSLYECIKDDPHILDGIDKIPFVDTPLHIAASAGHAHFALEMMRLMPSFSKKLNPQGLSPLDLALQKREDLRRNLEDLNLPNREELSKLQKELTQTIWKQGNMVETSSEKRVSLVAESFVKAAIEDLEEKARERKSFRNNEVK
ncbi:uncharacterized protein LOC114298381 [Camellia sinensis]|uniref:uncharacterized protein LOC114298381 n=1 Tax=Camellia sinensis TaxID=4442 RepID=UPI001035AB0C|nr:uncharacterized protein LOC114298381 [Camellia sinensis]